MASFLLNSELVKTAEGKQAFQCENNALKRTPFVLIGTKQMIQALKLSMRWEYETFDLYVSGNNNSQFAA